MAYFTGRVAGILFFIAGTQLLIGLVVAEALYPGYSVSGNYISDLGIGPSSAIFNSSIFLLGLLSVVGVYLLPRSAGFRTMRLWLALMAGGAMGAGIFTKAFPAVHGLVSSMVFLFSGLSAVVSYRVLKKPLSLVSVILGLIVLAALGLFGCGLLASGAYTETEAVDSVFFLGLGPGGMERMIVYPALAWLAGFSGHLIASSEEQAGKKADA